MQQDVAFDGSKQSSEAVIVDAAGNRLVSRKVATVPSALAAFVATYGEDVALVGFAAGPLSIWLYHELKAAGLPVVCFDRWRARAALVGQQGAGAVEQDRSDGCGRPRRLVTDRISSRRPRQELCGARGADHARGA